MSALRTKMAVVLRWYVAALLFLAPLKFTGIVGLADEPSFPLDGWQWGFFVWPPFLVPFLVGIAFVLSQVAHPGPVRGRGRWVVAAWSVLALAVLPGLVHTTEWEYALLFACHLASAAVLAAVVRRMLAHDPKARPPLAAALSVAVLWCCVSGVNQKFGGLERMRERALQQAAEEGRTLAGGLNDKLKQTRVYGSFASSANLYAAHLVLVSPFVLFALWRFGRRFEPTRVSQPLLAGIGALLFLGPLYWSGSRGAMLGLAAGLALGGLAWPGLRRWRLPLVLAILALGVGAMLVAGHGRGMLSASARLQYYRSAWLMFREHPVLGAGLGEFHAQHLRLRPLGAEPSRMPHNMPLGLLGQSGILAGLAALACLLLPAWLALSATEEEEPAGRWERLAVVVGLGAWSAHAVLDLNIQVPATVLTAACLPLLALRDRTGELEEAQSGWLDQGSRVVLLVLAAMCLLSIWRLPGEYVFQQFGNAIATRQPMGEVLKLGKAAARWLPTSPNPDRMLGRQMEATRNPKGAVEFYERVVRRAPHRSADWGVLARARLMVGDLVDAGAAIGVALEWNPGHPKYQALLALIRGIRAGDQPSPASAGEAFLAAALWAEYALDSQEDGNSGMAVRVDWHQEHPPPYPLPELAAWLAQHAGGFGPEALPVRFHAAAAWTNGE